MPKHKKGSGIDTGAYLDDVELAKALPEDSRQGSRPASFASLCSRS